MGSESIDGAFTVTICKANDDGPALSSQSTSAASSLTSGVEAAAILPGSPADGSDAPCNAKSPIDLAAAAVSAAEVLACGARLQEGPRTTAADLLSAAHRAVPVLHVATIQSPRYDDDRASSGHVSGTGTPTASAFEEGAPSSARRRTSASKVHLHDIYKGEEGGGVGCGVEGKVGGGGGGDFGLALEHHRHDGHSMIDTAGEDERQMERSNLNIANFEDTHSFDSEPDDYPMDGPAMFQRASGASSSLAAFNLDVDHDRLPHQQGSACFRLRRLAGLGYTALGALGCAVTGFCIQRASPYVPVARLFFLCCFSQAVLAALACWALGVSPFGVKGHRHLVLLRGVFGSLSMACYCWSVALLPLGDAEAIALTSTIWTSVLAYFVLGEKVSRWFIVAALASLGGIFLIAASSFPGHHHHHDLVKNVIPSWIGSLVALAGSIFAASGMVAARASAGSCHPLSLVFSFGGLGTVVSVVAMCLPFASTSLSPHYESATSWSTMPATAKLALVGIAFGEFVAQSLLSKALHLEQASFVTFTRNLETVFGYTLQVVFNHTPLTHLSACGSLSTLGGSGMIFAIRFSQLNQLGKEEVSQSVTLPAQEILPADALPDPEEQDQHALT
eukprot:GHVU01047890.1.p1 GENE.GHVU01047890.1~~GHVU01047890.1.p1  ORF type:complete len:619 (+),score=77.71 GHVU01047890.1:335-2191(+)